ncbi:hypothetical protein [Streptomyces sp. NBC_00233]|uniref:hypothetical protein n=1 Tax=Streptomyces sp. NBC_00233 TaxID=2975686 RepID=UPI00225B8CC6|nr:hypothetical protein [Streptomyces sp. NBC_00233]MCX5229682.1 hypothetical protein [Streptomyces sp. NBC_00233]
MIRNARIELNAIGTGSITVDGVPLKGVRSLSLDAGAGERPILRLELAVQDLSTVAETVIHVPDDTAATLVALGWTPPPGQPVEEVPDAAA